MIAFDSVRAIGIIPYAIIVEMIFQRFHMVSIRAIYHDGQLQLLDPVNLSEGQEVRLQILSDERSRVRDALSDLLVDAEVNGVDFDESALQGEIDEATQGITLSDLIIEERQTGR